MIPSRLQLLLITIIYLSCKLILHILWFLLNLFFYAEKCLLLQLSQSASKDISKVSSVETPRECYEPKNKRKCAEPAKERDSNDLTELNETELNYMYFEYKMDSDDAINNSDEDIIVKKPILFLTIYYNVVRISEGFSIRDILYWKTLFVFPNVEFFWLFLTETFVSNLCNFNIAENAKIYRTAFWHKGKYLKSFQF